MYEYFKTKYGREFNDINIKKNNFNKMRINKFG